jgi:hypothetical protein
VHRSRRLLLAALTGAVAACSLDQSPSSSYILSAVPAPVRLRVGGRLTVTSTVFDQASGGVVTLGRIEWQVSDTAIASVTDLDGTGRSIRVEAKRAGNAFLRGFAKALPNISDPDTPVQTSVEVRPALTLTLAPTAPAVRVGATVPVTLRIFEDGRELFDAFPRTWTSSAPTTAAVDSTGRILGVAPGTATVTVRVTSDSTVAAATAAVTVTP